MAQRIILHYFPGNSPLHRWDARCKFLGLLMIMATLIQLKIPWFIFDSILLIGLLILSRLPLRQFFRDFWIWAIFLFALFLFQAFFTPGSRVSAFQWLPVSQDGIRFGGVTCWRLVLILGYAILFTAVTRPRELRDALIWLLKPIPFLPERRIGLMVSLTLHFFSLTLDQAEEVRMAQRARLGDQKKNPFRKAKFLALPILRRSFSRAEEVTFALAARGYRDDFPLQLQKILFSHLIPLLIFMGFLIVMWLLL
ncbi:MAG: energy-coupling factor transporter transmembrane component T [Thermodesulfobacteriota bacterium]